MKPKHKKLKYALSGAAAGLINGFFGGGGGMLLIPLLTRWAKVEERKAFATCVSVILPLCAVSAAIYLFRNAFDFYAAWPYLTGGLLGGIIAGKTFQKIPARLLRKGLALLILYGGVKSLFWT